MTIAISREDYDYMVEYGTQGMIGLTMEDMNDPEWHATIQERYEGCDKLAEQLKLESTHLAGSGLVEVPNELYRQMIEAITITGDIIFMREQGNEENEENIENVEVVPQN